MTDFVVGDRAFESRESFIDGGRRCGTPSLNAFQKARIRSHMATLRASGVRLPTRVPIVVPVHVHVVHHGPDGNVSDTQLDRQIDVLNGCYAQHHITFKLVTTDRTDNPAWFKMTMGSAAERQAKRALGRDLDFALNFYTARIGAGLLGWATFPSEFAGDPERDGVVILDTSLPGGAATPYNEGKTAVHEIGHWLGLFHTFENGCQSPSDEIDDTPYEARENYGPANPERDTCPRPGKDPTTNYMDYTDDAGMVEFTPGQIARIREQLTLYRPQLFQSAPAAGMRSGLPIDFFTGDF